MNCGGLDGCIAFKLYLWVELEHQMFIFNYMMVGVIVLSNLLNAICNSMVTLINDITTFHHATNCDFLFNLLLFCIAHLQVHDGWPKCVAKSTKCHLQV
jgi:hypothetical protein